MSYQKTQIEQILSQLAQLELQIVELKNYVDVTNSANANEITFLKNTLSDK